MSATCFPEANEARPIISVIMANYNCADYLADAIASAQKQTLRDIEIIVSDDGSSDESVEIVTRLMAEDSRIRLIKSDRNSGPSAARNRAIAAAAGEWIAIMDSDDLMDARRLTTLLQAALRDGADLAADDLFEFSKDPLQPSRRLLHGKWARNPFWVDAIDYMRLNRLYGAGPILGYLKPLIRASLFRDRTVHYDETLTIAEDYNLVVQFLCAGKTMRVYPTPLYFYRKRSTSISHRLNEQALKALRAAELKTRATFGGVNPQLANAIDARIESLETALAYERLLAALKTKNWSKGFAIAKARPSAALLLRLALVARFRRFVPLSRNTQE
jgi:glycosyltransferase involved in cell wall biosynthesis